MTYFQSKSSFFGEMALADDVRAKWGINFLPDKNEPEVCAEIGGDSAQKQEQ
jgi:hypothetical protein